MQRLVFRATYASASETEIGSGDLTVTSTNTCPWSESGCVRLEALVNRTGGRGVFSNKDSMLAATRLSVVHRCFLQGSERLVQVVSAGRG
jgi:hypothetical protein